MLAKELAIIDAARERIFMALNGRAHIAWPDRFANPYGKGNTAYNKLRVALQKDWQAATASHYDGPFDDWNTIRKATK